MVRYSRNGSPQVASHTGIYSNFMQLELKSRRILKNNVITYGTGYMAKMLKFCHTLYVVINANILITGVQRIKNRL